MRTHRWPYGPCYNSAWASTANVVSNENLDESYSDFQSKETKMKEEAILIFTIDDTHFRD